MIPGARLPDWKPRLASWIAGVARKPFAWGGHDCALFLAGAVEAMTGHDPAAAFRGRYTTLEGGLELLRAAGFADHVALARAALPACPRHLVAAGDGAILPTEDGEALGVVQGEAIYVLSPRGLGMVALDRAHTFLRVSRCPS